MKKFILILLFFSLLISANSKPENLRAYLSYSTFYSPVDGPYLETYLSVLGSSVVFVKKDNGKFQGSVMITMLFKQMDSIKDFRKYELMSPEVEDTATINFSFLDQQRIPLPGGLYNVELSISDKNRDKVPFIVNEDINIDFPKDKLKVSGIELVESFTKTTTENPLSKSGYDFIPYMDNFFPESINKITFYSEVYNTSSMMATDDKFAISTYIQSYENNSVVSSFLRIKRETPKQVNVVFGEFDISKLPSGNYNLVVSVRDKNNQELSSNMLFFQRSNPSMNFDLNDISSVDINASFTSRFQNADSLKENIRSLFPIASANEKLFIKTQLPKANLEVMQKFFHVFWITRNNLDPLSAWNNYYEQILIVDKDFHSINKKGYETDRGRVYLQFGPPNSRTQFYSEPRAYPYEIWHYYKIGNQTNRKYIFYARENATNDFELLHSDVQGEIYNRRWEVALHARDTDRYRLPQDIDREKEDPYWGKHTDDYYNLPR
jgi:GWxTD domain-containing protein